MKYTTVAILMGIHFLAQTALGQDTTAFAKEGVIEIGGSFSYGAGVLEQSPNTFILTDASSDLFTISPFAGWFPIDDLEIGMYPFVSTIVTSGTSQPYRQTMFLLSTSLIKNINARAFIFIEGLIGLAHLADGPKVHISNSNYYPDYESPVTTSFSEGLATGSRIGFKYTADGKMILTVGLQYFHTQYNLTNSYTYFGYDHISYVAGFTVVL